MLDYLYCFDKNYNLQAFTSIFSIAEHSEKKANYYILHNEPNSFKPLSKELIKHPKIGEVEIIKFDKNDVDFPNLEKTHVSEATYFRLYLETYIPKSVNFLIYIDPDVICLNSPEEVLVKEIDNLKKSNFAIAAHTENIDKNELVSMYLRLGMKNERYFNAGVMIVNFDFWSSENYTKLLVKKMNTIFEDIVFWDQDVMNAQFDGDYLELDENLNFTVPIDIELYEQKIQPHKLNEIVFLHFAGKFKPWSVRGLFHPAAEFYQSNYRKLTSKKYHIVNNWKVLALKDLSKSIFTLKLLSLKHPLSFIYYVAEYLFRQNKKGGL